MGSGEWALVWWVRLGRPGGQLSSVGECPKRSQGKQVDVLRYSHGKIVTV